MSLLFGFLVPKYMMTLITTVGAYFQKVGIISGTRGRGFRHIFGNHGLIFIVPHFMPFHLKSTHSIPGVPKSQLAISLTIILKSHLTIIGSYFLSTPIISRQARWLMPVAPGPQKLRLCSEFKASLDYRMRSCLNKQKQMAQRAKCLLPQHEDLSSDF